MRILHLAHNFPPEFAGGTERYALSLARAQADAGHRVLAACGSEAVREDGAAVPFEHGGIRGLRLHRRPEEGYGLLPFHPRLRERVRRLVRDEGIEAAFVHHWFHLDLRLVRTLRESGLPVVLVLHDLFSLCPRFFRVRPGGGLPCDPAQDPGRCELCVREEAGSGAGGDLERRSREFAAELAAATEVVVFSRALAGFFRAWPPFPDRPLRILPPGIPEAGRWRRAARPLPAGPPWRVGFWGGLCRAKGLDLLVEALAAPELARATELHLWGPPLEEDLVHRIEAAAAAAGLPLRRHGPCPWEELPDRLAGLAAAAFPSRCFETYGLAVDEALLLGVPVVVPDLGALPERLGEGGLLCRPDDAGDLARALGEVLLGPAGPAAWRGRRHLVPDFAAHAAAVTALGG